MADTIASMPSVASTTRIAYSYLCVPCSSARGRASSSEKAEPPSTSTFMKRAKLSPMKTPLNSTPSAGANRISAAVTSSSSTAA
ncbi:hypothetical protein D9M68_959430 [compost metagenome]